MNLHKITGRLPRTKMSEPEVEAVTFKLEAVHLSSSVDTHAAVGDDECEGVGAGAASSGAGSSGVVGDDKVSLAPGSISVPLVGQAKAGSSPKPPTWWERTIRCFKMLRVR